MNKSAISDSMAKYIREVHDLMSIIVSEEDGIHIFSSFDQNTTPLKEKLVRLTTMIISSLKQCEGNLAKLKSPKTLNTVTFHYNDNVLHFFKNKHYFITLIMNPRSSGFQAAELSEEIATHFTTLNSIIPQNKNQ